eukprot:tig00020780_g13805.t1
MVWEDAKASLGHVITGVKWVVEQAGTATENQEDFGYLAARFQSLQETLERIYAASTNSRSTFTYSSKALKDLEGLIADGVSLIEDYATASFFSGVMRILQAGKYAERFMRIDKKLSAAVAGLTLDLSPRRPRAGPLAHPPQAAAPARPSPPATPRQRRRRRAVGGGRGPVVRPPPLPSVLLRVQEQAKAGEVGVFQSIFAASAAPPPPGPGGAAGGGEEEILRLLSSVGNGLLPAGPSPGRRVASPARQTPRAGPDAPAPTTPPASPPASATPRLPAGPSRALSAPSPPPEHPAAPAPPGRRRREPSRGAGTTSPTAPRSPAGAPEGALTPRTAGRGVVLPIRELRGGNEGRVQGAGCGSAGCMPAFAEVLPHSSDGNGILLQVGQRILIARPAYLCTNAGCGQYFDKLAPGVCRYHPTTGGTKGKPLACKKKCPSLEAPGCTTGEHASPSLAPAK